MKRKSRPLLRNWIIYVDLVLIVLVSAWISGERLLYLTLAVLVAMPPVSLALTFILLRLLQVRQTVSGTIVKHEPGTIALRVHNPTPMFFGNIQCVMHTDNFAVEIAAGTKLWLKALQTAGQNIPFRVKYRGVYRIGLDAVHAIDLMGLFRLKRKISKSIPLVVLPRVVEMTHFPLASHLLTQAHSRFDIKDEDYATISDIRPYLPTDSIKRIHWKLTAKRNEWLVKNFQSNALNKVTIILDSAQLPLSYKDQIIIEDRMVETALGLARFCLRKGMPVDFIVGAGHTANCASPAAFETIYKIGSSLFFAEQPVFTPLSMLTQCLNDAAGYLNAIIITACLNGELYERIANGINNGHYIAVLYFITPKNTPESDDIYRLLSESGVPCFCITKASLVEESEKEEMDVQQVAI